MDAVPIGSLPGFFATKLHPDDRERVLAGLLAAGAGAPLSIEHRFATPDGSTGGCTRPGISPTAPTGPRRSCVVCPSTSRRRARPRPSERDAESRFRRVVERLPAIVYLEAIGGPEGQPGALLYVSPQVRAILGFSADEWMREPTSWARHFHPDDRDRVRAIFQEVANGESMFVADYRMFTRDGEVRWFHDEAVLIRDEDGEPLFWQGTMQDITAQREQQAQTHDTESRYRTLLEQIPAIVYSEDVTGDGLQVVYINAQVRDLLGVEPDEWVANPSVWSDAIHPDDVDGGHGDERRHRDHRRTLLHRVPHDRARRSHRVVQGRSPARPREDGEPAFWQGVMIDITGRKQAEAQLAETEERYRTLVEQTPTITYIASLGRGNGVLYVSPQTEAILGYTPQDWYADPGLWSTIVHPDDLERNHPDPSVGEHSQRYRLIARDGREVWVHDQARLILDDAGEPKFWQGVLIDITQQQRAEALERDLASERLTSDQLREADAMKSTFLQAVSHDLRSPLAAILGPGPNLGARRPGPSRRPGA